MEIKQAADLYKVDEVLIASVINAESGYKPNAISNKGAVGLMQIMPSTAEWVGEKLDIAINEEILKNPKTNIFIGTYYLKYLLDKFGDMKTALIAYNAGEGNVISWLNDNKYSAMINNRTVLTSCPFKTTNRYVEKVLNGLNFYKLRV